MSPAFIMVISTVKVDDFLCAAEKNKTAEQFISLLNTKMTIDVKDLGIVSRYNGVDIVQTRNTVVPI